MTKKAFIFDLDGVIIDSESWWDKLYFKKSGHSIGQTINSGYLAAKAKSPHLPWKDYFNRLNLEAKQIYTQAPLTPGINQLLSYLTQNHYQLGLVSGSTQSWIEMVLKRLTLPIPLIISLHDQPQLQSKPAPDGYLAAIKQLQVKSENTLILEDSDLGIKAAKASGAFTICLTALHPKNYHPTGADLYVKSLTELLKQLPIKILPRTD